MILNNLVIDSGQVGEINQIVRINMALYVNTGAAAPVLTDPSTLQLQINSPFGTASTVTLAGNAIKKVSTGLYYYDLTLAQSGEYQYTALSGTPTASASGYAFCQPNAGN